MPTARERLVTSLSAIRIHIDQGGLADTALPGTPVAEAMRLVKNGVSVSAFACYEHFVRERIAELLSLLASDPSCPAFSDLPAPMQLAATRGVIEALRYRASIRGDDLDDAAIVKLAQQHTALVAGSVTRPFQISPLAFGYASANISGGTLNDFFRACNATALFNQIAPVLTQVDFDYVAAGLAGDDNSFRLSNLASWRHSAAHDATLSIDAPLLRTRVVSYLALAFAFDALASTAVGHLIQNFGNLPIPALNAPAIATYDLVPDGAGTSYTLNDHAVPGPYYSPEHCRAEVGDVDLPAVGFVVVRDQQGQVLDWFMPAK